MQQPIRKIIHVDMDAFYASIEQRDFPELHNKPVVVGGPPHSRGVVATASYEARKFGIHSAMPSSQAYRLCPHAIFVPTRFEVYKNVSQIIHSIFRCYTDLVEPLALDEAYLDVTHNKMNERSATRLAQHIQDQIWAETGLTASAGVSFNKFLAKLASGWKKPSGLTVIIPEQAQAFVEQLPIQKFYGVGKATAQKMLALGIHTGADLKNFGHQALMQRFGKMGDFLYHLVICQDERVVNPNRVRKSFGKETTFAQNVHDRNQLLQTLKTICSQLETSLTKHKCQGRTITLKIRYANFKTHTRSCTIDRATNSAEKILVTSLALLDKTEVLHTPIRLIGVSLSSLSINL